MGRAIAERFRGATDLNAGQPARYARYVLLVLVLVYIFNFIDRILLGVLVPLIKADLQLSDTQLGLLGGTAFALLHTTLGMPIGWLADRSGRVWIMTAAVAIWSAFTAACGLTQNFLQLFLARVGVGVGEAGGVAPAYSLLADYYPPGQRARALGFYSFGIPIGTAAGLVLGGLIGARLDWRAAFLIIGLAGLLLAPLLRLTVREPVRGGLDGGPPSRAPPLREVLRHLTGQRTFWGLALAAASSSIMGYGFFFWMPSFLVRSYHLTIAQMALRFGAIVLVGGVAGVWLGASLADRFGRQHRAAYAIVPAVALLLTLPFYCVGILLRPPGWGLAIYVVPAALGLAWLGPVAAAIQHLVPAGMRTLASSIFLFVNNGLGLGFGALLLGFLSDRLTAQYGPDGLGFALLAGTGFYVLSALIFLLTAARLAREWQG
jgi:MFS family permease